VHCNSAYFSRRVTSLRMEEAADANNTAKSAFSRLMRVTVSPQTGNSRRAERACNKFDLLKCADTFQLFLTPEKCTGHFVFGKGFKQRKTLRTKLTDSRNPYLVSKTISPKTLWLTRKSHEMERAYQGCHATRTFPK